MDRHKRADKPCKIKEISSFCFIHRTKMELKAVLEFISHFIPLVWKEVGIGVERSLYFLMS